jgi:hypothetical protein
MKKLLLAATVLLFGMVATAQTKPDDVIKLNTETHDFGKIKQGVPVTYYFEIKNITNEPIVIENASASCGCTVPEKPEKPIPPGKTDKLKVVYNAAAVGPINKDVYIKIAGVEQQKIIHLKGEVVAAQ